MNCRPFIVAFRQTKYHEFTVEAETMHEAVKLAKAIMDARKDGTWRAQWATEKGTTDPEQSQEVYAFCEGCALPRLENDEGWVADPEDGTETCPECVESMEEAS